MPRTQKPTIKSILTKYKKGPMSTNQERYLWRAVPLIHGGQDLVYRSEADDEINRLKAEVNRLTLEVGRKQAMLTVEANATKVDDAPLAASTQADPERK